MFETLVSNFKLIGILMAMYIGSFGANVILGIYSNIAGAKEEFSKLLGISGQYLGIVERGKSCLSIEKLKRLCDLTNTSADYILFGKNNNIKSETSKILESFSNEEIELGCETLKKLAVFIKSIN